MTGGRTCRLSGLGAHGLLLVGLHELLQKRILQGQALRIFGSNLLEELRILLTEVRINLVQTGVVLWATLLLHQTLQKGTGRVIKLVWHLSLLAISMLHFKAILWALLIYFVDIDVYGHTVVRVEMFKTSVKIGLCCLRHGGLRGLSLSTSNWSVLVLIKHTKLVFQILELGVLAIQVVKAFGDTDVGSSTSIGVCEGAESRLSSHKVVQGPGIHVRVRLASKKRLKQVLAIKVG